MRNVTKFSRYTKLIFHLTLDSWSDDNNEMESDIGGGGL